MGNPILILDEKKSPLVGLNGSSLFSITYERDNAVVSKGSYILSNPCSCILRSVSFVLYQLNEVRIYELEVSSFIIVSPIPALSNL